MRQEFLKEITIHDEFRQKYLLGGIICEDRGQTAKAVLEAIIKKWPEIQANIPEEIHALFQSKYNKFIENNKYFESLNDLDALEWLYGILKITSVEAGTPIFWPSPN